MQLYTNKDRVDFDLTDPHNYSLNSAYKAVADPHMRSFLRRPLVHKRLLDNGEVTDDDRVRCTVKEFNQYRAWLKHVALLRFNQEQIEEVSEV